MKEKDLKVKTDHSHAKQAVLLYPYLPLKDEAQTALFKDPVRTALQTLFISVIKTNQLIL